MKKKFESNVASEIPKTKTHEPELPWKISSDDPAMAGPKNDDLNAAFSGTAPLRTRAIFLILLVATMFLVTSLLIFNSTTENDMMRQDIQKREKEIYAVKTDLEKLAMEKDNLSVSSAQLEKKVTDLTAQKELFTNVIESLTKKSDEIELEKKEAPVAQDARAPAGAEAN
jgi:septal ring factor EnvC (AmiA/AmiB activator)